MHNFYNVLMYFVLRGMGWAIKTTDPLLITTATCILNFVLKSSENS